MHTNNQCIQEFNYLTFEEALIGAQDDNLHCTLRCKYVELIIRKFQKRYFLFLIISVSPN